MLQAGASDTSEFLTGCSSLADLQGGKQSDNIVLLCPVSYP